VDALHSRGDQGRRRQAGVSRGGDLQV
jgi:hypothetical protein